MELDHPVRWEETVRAMASDGVTHILEIGPGKVLSGLVRRIDKTLRVYSVEDPAGLQAVLAEVFK